MGSDELESREEYVLQANTDSPEPPPAEKPKPGFIFEFVETFRPTPAPLWIHKFSYVRTAPYMKIAGA